MKDIKLTIGAKTFGIIGTTGSGKTSLIKLITRVHNANSGKIIIDDILIQKFNVQSLRKNIGIVPQDSFLFSGTIINNIRFGNQKASKTEIEKICKITKIHNEIIKFKNGYNTLLGERGINLSGGQKQRICIARALLKKPKILILDDCLSALDSETEENIIKSLKTYIENTTTIISSHRLSSVENLDNIIVLHEVRLFKVEIIKIY